MFKSFKIKDVFTYLTNFSFLDEKETTIISKGSLITGDIKGSNVFIDGDLITKNLNVEHLEIGKFGNIKGDISSKIVNITGNVLGNIIAESIVLYSSSKVVGDISCNSILIHSGAEYSGNLSYSKCIIESNSVVNGSLNMKVYIDKDRN